MVAGAVAELCAAEHALRSQLQGLCRTSSEGLHLTVDTPGARCPAFTRGTPPVAGAADYGQCPRLASPGCPSGLEGVEALAARLLQLEAAEGSLESALRQLQLLRDAGARLAEAQRTEGTKALQLLHAGAQLLQARA